MKGMILAAGLGTRFRPVTWITPKPMIPLCGKPLIGYAVDALVEAGVTQIVVNLHHLPDQIEQWLCRDGRASFTFSFEPEILGTGGGIRKVAADLRGDESFFLLNADTVQFPPLAALEEQRRRHSALAALLLRHPPEHDRFTPVYFEAPRVTGFGAGRGEKLMFSGCHAISRELFELLPDRKFSGIVEDVYMGVASQDGVKLTGHLYDGPWFDIGSPRRYMEALQGMLELLSGNVVAPAAGMRVSDGSAVHSEARMEGTLERAAVEKDAVVDSDARVSSSAIWSGAKVGRGCVVSGSIIAGGVTLPEGAEVNGMVVTRRIDERPAAAESIAIGDLVATPVDPADAASAYFRLA